MQLSRVVEGGVSAVLDREFNLRNVKNFWISVEIFVKKIDGKIFFRLLLKYLRIVEEKLDDI